MKEYKTLHFGDFQDIEDDLNREASQGWRLVTVWNYQAYLERDKATPQSAEGGGK